MKLEASLVISNLDLPPTAALGGVEVHRDFLRHVNDGIRGYDGYELTPTRRLCSDIEAQVANGTFSNEVDGQRLIVSGHESWGEGFEGLKQSVTQYRPLGEIASKAAYGAVFVEQGDSLRRLARFKGFMSRTVVFGDSLATNGRLRDYRQYGLPGVSTQPSPELFAAWDASFPYQYDVRDQMKKQGIKDLTIDTFHLSRDPIKKGSIIHWKRFLECVEAYDIPISQVHLDGRNDMGSKRDRKHSQENLAAMLTSPEKIAKTRSGDILARTCAIWKGQQQARCDLTPRSKVELPIVIESPYKALSQVWEEVTGRRMKYETFVRAHQIMTENVRSYVAHCLKK